MLCEIKLLSHLSQCIRLASVKWSQLGAPDTQAHAPVDEHERLQVTQNDCMHTRTVYQCATVYSTHALHLAALLPLCPSPT